MTATPDRLLTIALVIALLITATTAARAAEPGADGRGDGDAPATPAGGRELPALPGIEIDREAGHVEIEAQVANQDAEWLELLVCSPNTREYESILTAPARPSHIHLALLLLDVEPGSPLSWRQVDDAQAAGHADDADHADGADNPAQVVRPRFVVEPPRGPIVEIYAIWEDDQGQRHEVPANEWVRNQLTDEPLTENKWLFTGSVFHRFPETDDTPARHVYMADLNGTIVSLVNFGDDLLTRPTTTTNRNDEQAWATRPDRVPADGTPVTLRLVPTGEIGGGEDLADEPADDADFVPPNGAD